MGDCCNTNYQDHSCTWKTFLVFLMLIMMSDVANIQLDITCGFQKYILRGYLMQEKSSRTSLYLEDMPDHPDHPYGYQDPWSHLHSLP